MGLGNILIFAVIGILLLSYFAPAVYEDLKDKAMDFLKGKAKDLPEDDFDEPEDVPVAETNQTITNSSINACGKTLFGLPNYDGTPKVGDTCAEVVESEANFECLANPPKNYDGYINTITKYSYPTLTCCYADGTCQWEAIE